MRPPDEIRADIERLRRISVSGVMRYRHGEREATFSTAAEIDGAIAKLEAELADAVSGAAPRPPAISRIRSRGRGL